MALTPSLGNNKNRRCFPKHLVQAAFWLPLFLQLLPSWVVPHWRLERETKTAEHTRYPILWRNICCLVWVEGSNRWESFKGVCLQFHIGLSFPNGFEDTLDRLRESQAKLLSDGNLATDEGHVHSSEVLLGQLRWIKNILLSSKNKKRRRRRRRRRRWMRRRPR